MLGNINKANEELAAEREQEYQAVIAKLKYELELCREEKRVYRSKYRIEKLKNEKLATKLKKSEELHKSNNAAFIHSRLMHSKIVNEADGKIKHELAEIFAKLQLESAKLMEETKKNAESIASQVLGIQRERENVDTCMICDEAHREIIGENKAERRDADSDGSDAGESEADQSSVSGSEFDSGFEKLEAKDENKDQKEKQDHDEIEKEDDDEAAILAERIRLINENYLAWERPKPYFEEVVRRRTEEEEWWTK